MKHGAGLGALAGVLALIALAVLAAYIWITTPVVVFGHPSGRCLMVEPGGTCDDLPGTYRRRDYSDRWGDR